MATLAKPFPLHWPAEHGRSSPSQREKSSVKTPVPTLYKSIQTELKAWKAGGFISSNLKLKNDGSLYAKQPKPEDTAVVVYFSWHGGWYGLSMDHYSDVAGNLKEIREMLATFRRIGNVYNASIRQKMLALVATIAQPQAEQKPPPRQQAPPPTPKPPPVLKDWQRVLGLPAVCPWLEVKKAFDALAKKHHPDKVGGNTARMQQINAAYEQAKKFYRIGKSKTA